MITVRLEIDQEGTDWLVHVRAYNKEMLVQTIAFILLREKPELEGYKTSLGNLLMNVNDDCFWVDEVCIDGKKYSSVEEWEKRKMKTEYEQGKGDLAEQIYAILKTHVNEDYKDVLKVLEKHLTEVK